MATTIRISGVDIERAKGSLIINTAIGQRSTASFIIVDRPGTASYQQGQLVEIFSDFALPPFIHPQFGGYINSVRRTRVSPSSPILYHVIDCVDYHYCADKRRAAEAYVTETAGFIVDDLFDKYLAPEGVTIGDIQPGPTISEMVINYQPLTMALDALAERSGFIWYIDEFKRLFFTPRTTTIAPFAITDADIIREGGMSSELNLSNSKYRNRQYIRAGRDVTSVQTENRTGDGETVAFAMGYPLNQEPVITVAAAGQTMGLKGIDDPAIECYWAKGDPVITFVTAPGIGAAIVVIYYGEYDIMVQVDKAAEQTRLQAIEGGTGIVEFADDEPQLTSKVAAFNLGIAKLDKYGVIGRQIVFPIRDWGIKPGQMVTITYPEYGLTAVDFLVEAVDISEIAPDTLRYEVKAIEGPETGDWTGFFKALANQKEEILGRLNIGKDQILIILAAMAMETWHWTETVNQYPYPCSVPALDLYPALLGLYPC